MTPALTLQCSLQNSKPLEINLLLYLIKHSIGTGSLLSSRALVIKYIFISLHLAQMESSTKHWKSSGWYPHWLWSHNRKDLHCLSFLTVKEDPQFRAYRARSSAEGLTMFSQSNNLVTNFFFLTESCMQGFKGRVKKPGT